MILIFAFKEPLIWSAALCQRSSKVVEIKVADTFERAPISIFFLIENAWQADPAPQPGTPKIRLISGGEIRLFLLPACPDKALGAEFCILPYLR